MNESQIISIPNWISTRVYKALKGCTLAYAVNERTKELVVFEDLTARIWDLILCGATISEIYAFAKDNDADDEIEAFLSSIKIASCAHTFVQIPQPTHFLAETRGLPALCISILPALEPHPIPRFLMAPPNPAAS